MNALDYTLDPDDPATTPMGLIVLQTDETLEQDMRHYFAQDPSPIYVSRVPSAPEVTPDTLASMAADLTASASLLPDARRYRVVGYGCTSASAVIGSDAVEGFVQRGCDVEHVTNPLRATIAQLAHLGLSKLALLSPYISEVNQPLRAAFAEHGVQSDVFGTFEEVNEQCVVRISNASIVDNALKLGSDSNVEAVFLSCTNLRTRLAIPEISQRLNKPVLSSNQALAWHMSVLNK